MNEQIKKMAWGVMVVGLGWGLVFAADKPTANAMDPAAMKAMRAFMTPGDNHRKLDPLVGKWDAKVTMWMMPGAAPQVSQGTSDNVWILDNHFLQSNYKGNFNGQPFEGMGLTGFDNVRGEYQSIWIDNFATGMMIGSGPAQADAKKVDYSGTFGCPMTAEKNRWYRSELTVVSPDKNIYASYSKGPDGKEFKGMEIVYTRAKS